jgi:hypothetical protein
MKHEPEILRQLLEVVSFYKGIVLDSVEQACGEDTNWTYIRSRLLKAFGDRGMEGRIREIINTELNDQGGAQ